MFKVGFWSMMILILLTTVEAILFKTKWLVIPLVASLILFLTGAIKQIALVTKEFKEWWDEQDS